MADVVRVVQIASARPACPAMGFRPCIDLHNGVVKQIIGSSLRDDQASDGLQTNFVAQDRQAADYALMYKADGLWGGHIIMLGPGCEEAALAALQAYPQGLQIGGGITPENALQYLQAGASHVIVTSYLFGKEPELSLQRLQTLSRLVGRDRLVIDLSCRRKESEGPQGPYYVVKDRWQTFTNFIVNKEHLRILSEYCAEFLVHGVEVEGKRVGILEDLVVLLGEQSPLEVTYAGGARHLEDLQRVSELGKGKVHLTIGSALDIFGGDVGYSEVVEWHHRRQQQGP